MDARPRTWLTVTFVIAVVAVLLVPQAASSGVNGDGDIDIVFTNSPGRNRVCLGDGSGGFVCSDVSTDTNNTQNAAVADVNNDGDLDVVFANSGQRNRVCVGNGSGGFVCSDVSTDTNASEHLMLGDVDGDGEVDAVFGNVNQRNRVCLGDGLGGFSCSDVSTDTNGTAGVGLGDVDRDGNLDAAFANTFLAKNRVCLGDGSGGFACSDVSADADNSSDLAVGDVSGDGRLDAVFANLGVPNRLCLGDGSGGFTCSDVSSDTNTSGAVALGNIDGDSNLDAVFGNVQRNRVCLGDGSGGFACSDVSTDSDVTPNLALGDVNRDGNLDAVVASESQRNRVCLGDGSGGFACSDVSTDTNNTNGVALTPSGVERLAGLNRFATAAEISESAFDPAVPAAYVATGGNFPDALAGGPVAALNGGPILLLSSIPGETAAELTRLQPQKIVILGGTGVVSAVDAAALAAFTAGPVERLSGANRFATAAAISASEFSPGVPVAYVATGANFPDALAGGPVAAINGGPILLVNADSIPAVTALELARLQPQKIVILGGTGVVSDTVATQLGFLTAGAVERLAGANRFATAAAISASLFSPGVGVVYIATGANFPDALAGGPVAGINGGPILLVNQDSIPGETAAELTRLAPKKIVILGGTGVVSTAVEAQLAPFVGDRSRLVLPLGGVPNEDWFIVNYQDHDPGPGLVDYMGLQWGYDQHNGTDFSLKNFEQMDGGVSVLAAAGGTVVTVVDGNHDRNTCGIPGGICAGLSNRVVIEHGNGQRASYNHLRKDSVLVSVGDTVQQGEKIAEVGSSGNSSSAHLHFFVMNPPYNTGVSGGSLVDPFETTPGNSHNLWLPAFDMPYAPTTLNVLDGDTTDHNPTRLEYTERVPNIATFNGPFATDDQVWFWLQLNGSISSENSLTVRLERPSGVEHWSTEVPMGAQWQHGFQEYHFFLDFISMIETGTWRWVVEKNGTEVLTRPFTVTA